MVRSSWYECGRAEVLLFLFMLVISANSNASSSDVRSYLRNLSLVDLFQLEISSVSKYPEKISDIPASVYIISRAEIEQSGYHNLVEVLRSIPGIYHTDNYDSDLLGVRGVLGTGDGDIALLVNGALQVSNNLKYLTVPVESIDRIEFIRGPMSIIYGSGAFLGAINVITNMQVPHRANLVVEQLSGDSPGYRSGVRWGERTDDSFYIANIYNESLGGIDVEYREMMSSDQLATIPMGAHQSTKNDLERNNWGVLLVGEWKGFSGQFHYQHAEREGWILTPSFHDGNRELSNLTNMDVSYQYSLSNAFRFNTSFRYGDFSTERRYDFISPDLKGNRMLKGQRIESEITLLYQSTDWAEAFFGLNYLLLRNYSYSIMIPFQPLLDLDTQIIDADRKTYSAFFQAKFRVSEDIEFVAGARINKDKNYTKTVSGNVDFPTLSNGAHNVLPDEHSIIYPRVAMIFHYDAAHNLKFIYGEATKSGADIASSLEAFGISEHTNTSEFNYLFSRKDLIVSFSLFRNESKNLGRFFQTYSEENGFETVAIYSGQLEAQGSEFWIEYKPLQTIKVNVSVTYVEVEDKNTDAAVGNSPRFLYKMKISHSTGKFLTTLSARYKDSMFAEWNILNSDDGSVNRVGNSIRSSLVIDGNLRYSPPSQKYGISFKINNITNNRVRYPASENAPFAYGLLGPKRSYYLTFNYHLD